MDFACDFIIIIIIILSNTILSLGERDLGDVEVREARVLRAGFEERRERGPGLHKATGFFEKSRTKKSQRLAFFEIFNRKKPAAGFFLLFSGFFFNLMKFGQIPTKFQENFDEMRSDLIKIPKKYMKFWKTKEKEEEKKKTSDFARFLNLERCKGM